MPIDISEFSTPALTKLQQRYPMSYNKEDRFNEINPTQCAGRYQGSVGREGGWKMAGYNHSTRIETFKIRSDNITLKPY